MYEGRIRSIFARYAIPQMIGLLFNSVYMIVDGVFIGNRLGREAMAAAAVAVPVIEVLIALSMAVASGAGIMISAQVGRGEEGAARRTFNTVLAVAAFIGVVIAVAGTAFLEPLARLLGATEQIHEEACAYLWYIVVFSPFLVFSFLLGGLARNDGRPKLAMVALSVGSVSNIVLDYVFMYPMNMGVAGAALATAIGPIVSVIILLPHFLLRRGCLYLTCQWPRLAIARQIAALGFPSFVMEFTIGIVTLVYNAAIVRWGYGELGLAAYLVIGYLMLIYLTVFLGMAEGLQPVFSHFMGAGQWSLNHEMRRYATWIFLAIGVLAYVLIAFFGRRFYAMFTPDDTELLEFAMRQSIPYFSGFFLAGYNILMISYWQSTKSTGKALIVSSTRSFVLPPLLICILPALFGASAIWICHSLTEAITACVALALLRMGHGLATTTHSAKTSAHE